MSGIRSYLCTSLHTIPRPTTRPGWRRFKPADTWLAERALAIKKDFDEFMKVQAGAGNAFTITDQEREALFKQFLLWQASQQ